jgi:hypothetical protein
VQNSAVFNGRLDTQPHPKVIRLIELGVLRERQRIEKLLPEILRIGNIDYLFDIEKEMPELVQEAKALIKESKSA